MAEEDVRVFMVVGDIEFNKDRPETYVRLSSTDSDDLLKWLGYPPDDFGALRSSDLAARCRRRLWPIARNYDPEIPAKHRQNGGAVRVVVAGRPAGYLRGRTEELLRLAERAGPEGDILFS